MFSRGILVITQVDRSWDYGKCLEKPVEYCPEEKGLERIREIKPDLVIIDCGIMTHALVRLLINIKSMDPGTPVIFVVGHSPDDLVIDLLKNGARDFFKKPVDTVQLRKSVDMVLRFRQEHQEKRYAVELVGKAGNLEHYAFFPGIPENILHAVHYIENNFSHPLSLDQVAREVCMSKYHFCRQFNKYVGMSPIQFAINERIRNAIALLRRKELPVSLIAIQAGFNELSEFNKQFKKLTGYSPTDFRSFLDSA